jgi:hypothetical protein
MAKTHGVSLVVGALLAGAAIAACGSVNSGPRDANGGGPPDAGPGGPPDARPVDVDGGPGDIDSGVPNPRGTVHVTVVDPSGTGVPAVGVTVVFIDPDGTVVKTASTDSTGKTSADVLPGASVTTVIPAASAFRMRTMLAVKPGDDLVIGPKVIDTQVNGTFTLTWPDDPTHATTFSVYGPCGLVGVTTFDPTGPSPTAPTTLTFGVQNGCRPNPAEFLVWARGQQGISLFFNDSVNVPFAPNGSFAMPSAWNSQSFSATYTNLSLVSTITSDRIVPDGGRSFPVTNSATDPISVSLPGPIGVTARMVSKFSASSGSAQTVRQKLPGASTTYALNVNEALLAWLSTPTFDVAAQEFHIVEIAANTGGAPAPDLLRIVALWDRPGTAYTWEVFGPEATTVKLPVLPATAGAGLNPTTMDFLRTVATSYEADTVTGYDAVRGNAGAAITDVFEAPRSAATLIRVSASPPPPPPPL